MRRVWLLLALPLVVSPAGCGRKSYEDRLDRTIKQLEYDRRLAKNLMPAPADKKFQELAIYLRPPKEEAQAKPGAGGLPVSEGQFDLDTSFVDKADSTLHVLARVKMPKKPLAKGAPPPPPPAARGEFVNDVLGVLSSITASEGQPPPKFAEESKKANRFRRLIFDANGKEVKAYFYKDGNHEVALIFVYPPAQKGAISSKIDLCLESFAAGPRAARLYTNGGVEEEAEATAPLPQ